MYMLVVVLLAIGVCRGQQCPGDTTPAMVTEESDVCPLPGCEFSDTTLSIETINAREVKFVFVVPDGEPYTVTDTVTETGVWVRSEASYAMTINCAYIDVTWATETQSSYSNFMATACGPAIGCNLTYCQVNKTGKTEDECKWVITIDGKKKDPPVDYKLTPGQKLCIECHKDGKAEPFEMKIARMKILGKTYPLTVKVEMQNPSSSRPTRIDLQLSHSFGRTLITDPGHKITKMCITADKEITIKDFEIWLK